MPSYDGIYYDTLLNKVLWVQSVYQAFNALDDANKDKIIIKVYVFSKQQNFGALNIKSKLEMNIMQWEVPKLNIEAINQNRKEHIRVVLAITDDVMSHFGIANKINKIILKTTRSRPKSRPRKPRFRKILSQRNKEPRKDLSLHQNPIP